MEVSRYQKVEFVLKARFPDCYRPKNLLAAIGNKPSTSEEDEADRIIGRARSTLLQFPDSELDAIYDEEAEKAEAELLRVQQEKERQDDLGRPFSKPEADADFEHWAVYPRWHWEQFVSLSFGKDPNAVKPAGVQMYMGLKSRFAIEYMKRHDLVKAAAKVSPLVGGLGAENVPLRFIEWAEKCRLSLPDRLVALVRERGFEPKDWEQLFKRADARADQAAALADRWKSMYEQAEKKNAALQDELSKLVKVQSNSTGATLRPLRPASPAASAHLAEPVPTQRTPEKKGADWPLKEKVQRDDGLAGAIHAVLKAAHDAGLPRPNGRNVIEAFTAKRPASVSRVHADGCDYGAKDDEKSATIRQIDKRIEEMTTRQRRKGSAQDPAQ